MNKTFSVIKSIKFGWATFWANPKFWIIATFLVGGLSMSSFSPGMFTPPADTRKDTSINQSFYPTDDTSVLGAQDISQNKWAAANVAATEAKSDTNILTNILIGGLVAILVVLVVGAILIFITAIRTSVTMGYIHLLLSASRGGNLDYKIILSDVNLNKALKLLAVQFLYGFIVFLGFIFFIIPGIYLMLTYSLASYFVIDKNAGIGESFSLSAKATKGNKLRLWGLSFVSFFVILAGLLCLIVGIIPAQIIVSLAYAHVYASLNDNLSVEPVIEPTPVVSA